MMSSLRNASFPMRMSSLASRRRKRGPRPGGQNLATGFFSFGLAFFAALYFGVADAALACLHETLATRQPLGRAERLLDNPPTRFAFAELLLQHRAAAAMLEWAISRHREPSEWTEATFPDLVATKDVVTRAAVEIVQRAFQLAGGVALWRRLPFERYLRDVQGGPIHPLNHGATLSLFGTLAAEDRRSSVLGWHIH
ncbi:MAG: hypothetical protein KatS3mg061_3133 [Dehalococcoidia bacterium]|nr:MAG: hypothetical protein KatS3mg061_3133 [Dehalococcoidia bacterium]